MRTQLFCNDDGRLGFCLGRYFLGRLKRNETLGEFPHLWSGTVHLEIPDPAHLRPLDREQRVRVYFALYQTFS